MVTIFHLKVLVWARTVLAEAATAAAPVPKIRSLLLIFFVMVGIIGYQVKTRLLWYF